MTVDTMHTTIAEQDCEEMFCTLSLYTLFNLALVHHMGGRESGDESLLAKAKAIDGQIIRAAKDDHKEPLLQCLVLNALADIHRWMCGFDTSALYMEVVTDIASYSLCLGNSSLITDDEAESILLNQLFVQYPCAAKPA
jgi:hypothetical protein